MIIVQNVQNVLVEQIDYTCTLGAGSLHWFLQ